MSSVYCIRINCARVETITTVISSHWKQKFIANNKMNLLMILMDYKKYESCQKNIPTNVQMKVDKGQFSKKTFLSSMEFTNYCDLLHVIFSHFFITCGLWNLIKFVAVGGVWKWHQIICLFKTFFQSNEISWSTVNFFSWRHWQTQPLISISLPNPQKWFLSSSYKFSVIFFADVVFECLCEPSPVLIMRLVIISFGTVFKSVAQPIHANKSINAVEKL